MRRDGGSAPGSRDCGWGCCWCWRKDISPGALLLPSPARHSQTTGNGSTRLPQSSLLFTLGCSWMQPAQQGRNKLLFVLFIQGFWVHLVPGTGIHSCHLAAYRNKHSFGTDQLSWAVLSPQAAGTELPFGCWLRCGVGAQWSALAQLPGTARPNTGSARGAASSCANVG